VVVCNGSNSLRIAIGCTPILTYPIRRKS
jgi:hypothetical protein